MGASPGERLGSPHPAARALAAAPRAAVCIPKASPPASAPSTGFPGRFFGMIFGKTENWARVTYHRARLKLQERMDEK